VPYPDNRLGVPRVHDITVVYKISRMQNWRILIHPIVYCLLTIPLFSLRGATIMNDLLQVLPLRFIFVSPPTICQPPSFEVCVAKIA
jgi:hypothetical protein